jgi:hypothetical protein
MRFLIPCRLEFVKYTSPLSVWIYYNQFVGNSLRIHVNSVGLDSHSEVIFRDTPHIFTKGQ